MNSVSSDDGLHSYEMAGLDDDEQLATNVPVIGDAFDSDDSQGDPIFMPPQAAHGIEQEGQLPKTGLASMTAIPEEDHNLESIAVKVDPM